MEYTITESPELTVLIEEVNRLIGEGWLPLGGVASLVIGPNQHFAQAMMRDRDRAEEDTEAVEVATVSGLLFYKSQAARTNEE